MTYKQRIGVIFGGRSGEHEVSLSSAASVIENLDPQRYDVIPIMITPEGSWLWGKKPPSLEQAPSDQQPVPVVTLPADPTNQHMISMQENVSLPHDGALDVLFPVLHGPNGEDGTIQGLFDLANIPYVGCGVLASAVGMDKIIMKQLFQVAGLPIVDYLGYRRHEWERDPERIIVEIEQRIPYPSFVKPANLGSSVGVSKARNREELIAAIELALSFDRKMVVEQGLNCREFSCAVLGNDEPAASVVGEILPGSDFSDYNDKYINHTIQFVIPSHLPTETSEMLRDIALRAYQLLDLSGLARVDFFLDTASGQFYLNEVNTLPGFTSQSLYPKLWRASGLEYARLLDRLIELAIERHEERQQQRTTR